MHLLAHPRAGPDLIQRWQQQVASQWRRRRAVGPRLLAALSYVAFGPIWDGLIDVRRLLWVVAHDQRHATGDHAIRVAGFSASATAWGLRIGGADQCRFDKDLALAPGNDGRRFRPADAPSLSLALDLDRLLARHAERPHFPRREQWRWPRFWAAIPPQTTRPLVGSGPEFDAGRQLGDSPADALAEHRRMLPGKTLYPLEFVSHLWRDFRGVYADLTTIPKRQVINVDAFNRRLIGFQGALEFDLWQSRFSNAGRVAPRSR